MDRFEQYYLFRDKIDEYKRLEEAAKWSMAKLVWEQCQETTISETALRLGVGKHHVIYMRNAWERRAQKPNNMAFGTFYNSQLVRGRYLDVTKFSSPRDGKDGKDGKG